MSDETKAIQEFSSKGHALATADVASTRALAEVQGAMVIAKRFPRDETLAYNSIMKACRRTTLAEQAMYAYPRGGQKITGPSIRLAEVLARAWGNLDFGVVELEQRHGESSMMAYAWDLETNTRYTKVFQVPHRRKARGSVVILEDPRDVYEMNANQAARRLRACILGIIPGDIVEAAVNQCETTLAGASDEPLIDRVRKVVVAFDSYGITKGQIERRFGHTLETLNETEFVSLRKIYQSVRDGMSKPLEWFEPEVSEAMEKANGKPKNLDELTDKMKAAKQDDPMQAAKDKAAKIEAKAAEDSSAPTPEEMAEDEKAHAKDGREYQLESEEKPKKRGGRRAKTKS